MNDTKKKERVMWIQILRTASQVSTFQVPASRSTSYPQLSSVQAFKVGFIYFPRLNRRSVVVTVIKRRFHAVSDRSDPWSSKLPTPPAAARSTAEEINRRAEGRGGIARGIGDRFIKLPSTSNKLNIPGQTKPICPVQRPPDSD